MDLHQNLLKSLNNSGFSDPGTDPSRVFTCFTYSNQTPFDIITSIFELFNLHNPVRSNKEQTPPRAILFPLPDSILTG